MPGHKQKPEMINKLKPKRGRYISSVQLADWCVEYRWSDIIESQEVGPRKPLRTFCVNLLVEYMGQK